MIGDLINQKCQVHAHCLRVCFRASTTSIKSDSIVSEASCSRIILHLDDRFAYQVRESCQRF